MNILSNWLREYLPALEVSDRELADDLTLRGIAVEGVHLLQDGGHLFEMDITTNRVDAMNHYGIAREIAAIYNVPLLTLEDRRVANFEHLPPAHPADGPAYPVHIDAPDLCGRFTAQVIRGVTIGQSTGLVADRFTALGQKSISNAVDITNYTWLAMGHPTHVFDLDQVHGSIHVRRARLHEKLRLLDGSERVLTPEDLVIADEEKALGLAGIMGGWDSRVTENTRDILVEAAWFAPAAIRASSRRHGLHTDASHRYERGADLNVCSTASYLVTQGLLATCGGTPTGPLTDVIVPEWQALTTHRPHVHLSIDTVQQLLGTTLEAADGTHAVPAGRIEQYLEALGCRLRPHSDGNAFEVTLPSWRLDLEREIDLIEEIARVYGYNRFADTLPSFSGGVVALPSAAPEDKIRHTLLALGYTEALSSTFSPEHESTLFTVGSEAKSIVPMGNPLSAEAGVLRPSLLPGMVGMLTSNSNRDVPAVRLFEYGTTFTGSTAAVDEHASLALGAYGDPTTTPTIPASDALFFETKGTVEDLILRFNTPAPTFTGDDLPPWIEPGRGARILLDGKPLAILGELSTAERDLRKLRHAAVLAELHLPTLFAYPLCQPLAVEPSRFQAVERDLSFLFADQVRWSDIAAALHSLNIAEMISLTPIEIFRDRKGKSVPTGEYSLLFRMIFQSTERTLREEELTAWQQSVIAALTGIGGRHRAPEVATA